VKDRESIQILRELLDLLDPHDPDPEPSHKDTCPYPAFRPLRYYRRRTDPIDKTYMRFEQGGRPRCMR
jgi:hypothetical protein